MSGSWHVPWDLVESVGQELKRVRGAVYTRWMAQRDADWDGGSMTGAPLTSVVRGICPYEMGQACAMTQGRGVAELRQMPSPANCRGDRVRRASLHRPVPPPPQLGASAHSSGYFSPRPPSIPKRTWHALHSSSRKATSARAALQPRTSMTSWEGIIAQRQARRAELRRIFPHLADTGNPERRQALAIRGSSGSGDSSRFPTLHRVEPG